MKIDAFFPPPPQYKQKPLPCSDLTPARQNALLHLAAFAAIAESLVGPVPVPAGDEPPLYPATSRGFALHCYKASPFVAEVAELLGRSKLNINAADHVDAPHVMIIDVRKYWGVLGPIRGDIVLFADGQAAVVTQSLCMGCQNFEGISLYVDGPPEIVKKSHWTSTLKWIIRLVDEQTPVSAPAEPSEVRQTTAGNPQGESANQPPAQDAASTDTPAPDAAPPADGAPTGRKPKRTGIG